MGRTAVTGAASFLGSRILRRLVETQGPDALVAVDIASPPGTLGVRHRFVDFSHPASDQQVLDVFREEGIDKVVHAAFFTNPQRDWAYAHELESIGTLNLLAAAAAAGVGHVVMRSFTAVYGARGQNPSFVTEERPLQPNPSLGWVRDKLEAEQHAASFARRYPSMVVTVLRFAPLFGPGVRTFYTSVFDHRVVPVLMGYDPLVQLLHPDDALTAFEIAIEKAPRGAFNVVPKSAIPLVSALHLAAKIPVPVPHPIGYAAAEALWATGLGEAPGGFLDYVRFPFQADGEKARRELGFTARHTSRESLMAYLRYRHPRTASRRAEALA
ncbi:MAG: NAD-dependent epimerase/dehydratase family protein [Acidobacteria bacterium]|nr:NAD-dependent epimerase/dehydratase family protein [Acidobacteriota bacterium]